MSHAERCPDCEGKGKIKGKLWEGTSIETDEDGNTKGIARFREEILVCSACNGTGISKPFVENVIS